MVMKILNQLQMNYRYRYKINNINNDEIIEELEKILEDITKC